MVGAGTEKRRLEALSESLGIRAATRFVGAVSHRQVFERLAGASIYLSMSQNKSERLPNALKEAMYYGCACVVADSPGIRELLTDDRHGLVVKPGNVVAAAEGILNLFAEHERWQTLSNTARAAIRGRFDVDVLNRRRLDVWRGLREEASRS